MRTRILILAILTGTLLLSPSAPRAFPGEKRFLARLSSGELREYYGLQYLLGDLQKMEYLALPGERERSAWLQKFWIGVDPTPTTAVNETRKEHEQRVAAARRLFGRADAPGWDARGEILIRFGPPSFRTSIMGDVTPYGLDLPQEFWYYDDLNMSVTFTDTNLEGRFTYAGYQRNLKAPGPPGPGGNGGPFEPRDMDYIASPDCRWDMAAAQPYRIWEMEGMKAGRASDNFWVYLDTYAALYSSDTKWRTLPCYYDIVSFRAGDGVDRTEVSFEVPAKNLELEKGGEAPGTQIDLSVLVRDVRLNEVASGGDSTRIVGPTNARSSMGLIPGQIVLPLKPGRYHVGIEARERGSNRRAAFAKDVGIPAYTSSPDISDIQFAASIRETEENQRFVKGTLQIVPHPRHAYRISEPLIFYFEIYGLDTDREGQAYYRVEYRIVPLEKKRWGPVLQDVPPNISSTFETSGYGATQPQRLSIATNDLWQGPFRLEVTVTDRRTFHSATKSANFSILK